MVLVTATIFFIWWQLFLSPNQFLGDVLSFQHEGPKKKRGAPLSYLSSAEGARKINSRPTLPLGGREKKKLLFIV